MWQFYHIIFWSYPNLNRCASNVFAFVHTPSVPLTFVFEFGYVIGNVSLQSLSVARPLVSVYSEKSEKVKDVSVPLPFVFKAPIRPDLVNDVHVSMSKNARQPYCVNKEAGEFNLWVR